MVILPAIDLYNGRAVRLLRGDYTNPAVYSDAPVDVAKSFAAAGARYLHLVDLEGARDGGAANFSVIEAILSQSGLRAEVGGGIRDEAAVRAYLALGAERVILGTAAVTQPGFTRRMVETYGNQIAVGVDSRDGKVAIRGWTEDSPRDAVAFCHELEELGVGTVICTDISRDGALGGANTALYRRLSSELRLRIIASGGVSSLGDIRELTQLGLYGAIVGKALYTGDLELRAAIAAAGGEG